MGKQKFETDMQEEVEQRISKFSEENKKLLEELRKRKSNMTEMDDDEVDLTENPNEIIEGLKADIRRLEKSNERDNNMFFKHTQILDHKFERETKIKKELEEKVKSLQKDKEREADELNAEILTLTQQLSQQTEANIVSQEHFEIISEQNIRLKQIEEDYKLVAKHIDADYSEMNRLMEELREKSKEKEEELEQIKGFIAQKETENSKLQKHVVQSSQTIKELQEQLEPQNNEYENEKISMRQELDNADNAKIESLKSEMNLLISNKEKECEALRGEMKVIKKELIVSKQLIDDAKKSKVELEGKLKNKINLEIQSFDHHKMKKRKTKNIYKL